MQALNLKAFPGPAAFIAEESGHLHELASMANGLRPVLFRYSNNFPVDLETLETTISNSGIKDVAVVLIASTSSDLWLDEEHGPATVRICRHLQSQQGVQLHFIVKPTTSDAKRRWGPGHDVPRIFHGYLQREGQHLLVWDASKRPDPAYGGGTSLHNGDFHVNDLTMRVDAGLTLSNRSQSVQEQALAWLRSLLSRKAVRIGIGCIVIAVGVYIVVRVRRRMTATENSMQEVVKQVKGMQEQQAEMAKQLKVVQEQQAEMAKQLKVVQEQQAEMAKQLKVVPEQQAEVLHRLHDTNNKVAGLTEYVQAGTLQKIWIVIADWRRPRNKSDKEHNAEEPGRRQE